MEASVFSSSGTIFTVMRLSGGDWSKGDVFAVLGIVLALIGVIATIATPELRRAVGLESTPATGTPAAIHADFLGVPMQKG
jgi:hypothetical protein